MKKWESAAIEVVDIEETAFGPNNPDVVDSEQYQTSNPLISKPNDNESGYEQTFGES